MKTDIEFSIIIPWQGGDSVRGDSLQNLINCLQAQDTPASLEEQVAEIIIVEQKNGSLFPQLKFTERFPVKRIALEYDGPFNKSWCMNVGARAATYKHLIFTDADSLVGKNFFMSIKSFIRSSTGQHQDLFLCWNYVIALMGKDNPTVRWIRPDMTKALGGIWHCHAYTYFHVLGGMNENYFGYGGEDNDVYERALSFLKPRHLSAMPYPIIHQYHDWVKQSSGAIPYFEATRNNPGEVIQRLFKVALGDSKKPTLIKMDDLL